MYVAKLRDHQAGQAKPSTVHRGIYIKDSTWPVARRSGPDAPIEAKSHFESSTDREWSAARTAGGPLPYTTPSLQRHSQPNPGPRSAAVTVTMTWTAHRLLSGPGPPQHSETAPQGRPGRAKL